MSDGVIKSADGISLNNEALFSSNSKQKIHTVFKIPAYQRPYVWKEKDWENLFDDIEGNVPGYFVGAILCVDNEHRKEHDYLECEVIDGQQRLTTLSLLLLAIYAVLDNYSKNDLVKNSGVLSKKITNEKDELTRQLLVTNAKDKFVSRVIPQYDDNKDDYFNIIIQKLGIAETDFFKKPEKSKKKNDTKKTNNDDKLEGVDTRRQLARAYLYFEKRLKDYAVDKDEGNNINLQVKRVLDFSLKVNLTTVVMIKASTPSKANMLFEALNNRGVPLTITHLIRNKLLGEIKAESIKITSNLQFKFDHYKDTWNKILGEGLFKSEGKEISSGEQERFFRQSYNAFRFSWIKDESTNKKFGVGKKANLYDFYSAMIDSDPETTFNQIMESAKLYLQIQGEDASGISENLNKLYKDLNHVNGSTSYTLILYIIKNLDSLGLHPEDMEKICHSLINFFVRRNITNKPTYNNLDQIFLDFIKKIRDENLKGEEICNKLTEKLKEEVGKDFENILRHEDSYDNFGNDNVYFILTKLAEYGLHGKSNVDFWKESDKRKPEAWNIEHVLPQTIKGTTWEKVLTEWAEKNPDKGTVEEIHKNYLNKIGNLTLTQYNSEMGNKSFLEKLNLTKDKHNIGYKNELATFNGLNQYIVYDQKGVERTEWTPDEIESRTQFLVDKILDLEIFKW